MSKFSLILDEAPGHMYFVMYFSGLQIFETNNVNFQLDSVHNLYTFGLSAPVFIHPRQ